MNLQGRDLGLHTIHQNGDDVALLHRELSLLGLAVPEAERQRATFARGTHEAVASFQRERGLQPTGIVNAETASALSAAVAALTFVVRGRVLLPDGKPVGGALVRAFDQDLRSEEPLGEAAVDGRGFYAIGYAAERFKGAESKTADLRVRAYDALGRELASSPILFNAGPEETVDLVVGGEAYRGPPEYEQLLTLLTPLVQGLSFDQLTEDDKHQDVTFLASETGEDGERIAFLILAHRHQKKSDLAAEIFYGLFRQGMPTALPALVAQSPDILRHALIAAVDANIIAQGYRDQADASLPRFKTLIAQLAMEKPTAEGKFSLGDLLATKVDAAKQKAFLEAYVRHEGPIEVFWQGLRDVPELKNEVETLQFTLQLGALTNNHVPLVRALQSGGGVRSLRELVSYDEARWSQLIDRAGVGVPPDTPGADAAERKRTYTKSMLRMIEDAFPTAVIADRLTKDQVPGKEHALSFLKHNQEFDLVKTRFEPYLAAHPNALNNVADKQAATAQIKTLQRLYDIAPQYAQTSALLKAGLHSAHAVTRQSRTTFLLQHGEALGGRHEATIVYERAAQKTATALNLLMAYGNSSYRVHTKAVPDTVPAQIEGIPDWATLFRTLDLCECEHCRSVYSPAAYFVDVLHFLKDRKVIDQITRDAGGKVTKVTYKKKAGTNDDKTVKDVLLERRPDLGDIELTCENTNTPLPYVDLANEVLENAIAPVLPAFAPFALPAGSVNELDQRNVAALRTRLTPNLSEHAVVTVRTRGKLWTIDEPAFTYTIRLDSGVPRVLARSLQTSGTAQERAAEPQYMNAAAYDKLRQQVFPWSLPFDLWTEEARAYLDHLGAPRHRVMETLLPGDRAAVLAALAREHLGLTPTEAGIVTGQIASQSGAANPGIWNLWGFAKAALDASSAIPDPADSTKWIASGNWLADALAARVDVFLQQSGLAYKEMLSLLGIYYVNPAGPGGSRAIRIESKNPDQQDTCETSQLKLAGLDEAATRRIVRFVRLWRRTGWTMAELDQAITALRPADLNDAFLIQLSHIKRVSEATGLRIVSLLTFWADMDKAAYVDHEAPGQPQKASLYEQLFRNKSTITPLDQAFVENPDLLAGRLSEHISALAAALALEAQELTPLLSDVNVVPDDSDPTKTDDALNLKNLSRLYRHATLAKALELTARDYLSLLKQVDDKPFRSPLDTVLFVERVEKLKESGFSVTELDYLLRHAFEPAAGIAPTDEEIALILDDIRGGLQKIATENTFAEEAADPNGATTDPNGDLTKKKLALLNWDTAVIERAVAVLGDTATFEAQLGSLAPGIVFPEALIAKISYDDVNQKLRFSRVMTLNERDALLTLQGDQAFKDAVNTLFAAPRTFVRRHMASFSVPNFAVELLGPQTLKFPNALKHKAYYDAAQQKLHVVGAMTEAERSVLRGVSNDASYRTALDQLFAAPDSFVPQLGDAFLSSGDANLLFDTTVDAVGNPIDADYRFRYVLKKLLPHLRLSLSQQLVTQKLADALRLEVRTSQELLTKWMSASAQPTQKAVSVFLDDTLVGSNLNVRIARNLFPAQFETFTKLHKAALVIGRLELTPSQLAWAFGYPDANGSATVPWLDLNALPLTPNASASPSFQAWEHLVQVIALRGELPRGATLLPELIEMTPDPAATPDMILERLTSHTRWDSDDLKFLVGAGGFNLTFPDGYRDEQALARLAASFALLKRLGMTAQTARALANAEVAEGNARAARQAVRSKYDAKQWLTLAKPLRDPLREKQRTALVTYLVTHPDRSKTQPLWRDINDLYAHFLIDVEMTPCMLTSRIKQAIGSAQLFVQRCLMNLEKEVTASAEIDDAWLQWKWMKSYRVWEANRKVFLYPENWIEPELRDDKSAFFKELESQLLQNDVTLETTEAAFLAYLEKLDEVARLEIVGMYRQEEYDLAGQTKVVDILHVFGRTRGTPHRYFYRRRMNSAHWTAWEKVDVDIGGEHLVPVVWNQRLFLFWLVFTEKQEEVDIVMPGQGEPLPKGSRYWEIQLAWSEYKGNKWLAKKISTAFEYFVRVRMIDEKEAFTCKAFTESGSLVIRLYHKVASTYYLPTKYQWQVAAFRFAGCDSEPSAIVLVPRKGSSLPPIVNPHGTEMRGMMFIEETDGSKLELFEGRLPSPPSFILRHDEAAFDNARRNISVLDITPGIFKLLSPHQDWQISSSSSFFFHDDTKTFFVVASNVGPTRWWDVELIEPTRALRSRDLNNEVAGPSISAPIGSSSNVLAHRGNPMAFEGPASTRASRDREEDGRTVASSAPAMRRAPSAPDVRLVGDQLPNLSSSWLAPVPIRDYTTLLEPAVMSIDVLRPGATKRYLFQTFYHPYVCSFISLLNGYGVDGFLQRPVQLQTREFFELDYRPTGVVIKVDNVTGRSLYPRDDVDFTFSGAYSIYNWELFFHAPLLIADRLSKNQRFEEAQKWFHYIFDPTDTSSDGVPQRYWRTRPFFETTGEQYERERIPSLLRLLSSRGDPNEWAKLTDRQKDDVRDLEKQVDAWRKKPFKPHLIARLRTTAYQKTVVMKYIDNLIAWGDQLFRRDTIESINEATQLYILAADMLGRRPPGIPPRALPQVQTFNTLEPNLDTFSNALVEIEAFVSPSVGAPASPDDVDQPPLPLPTMLYFCVPKNDKLLGYWDTVADRLFKLRHCMNIEGVVRQLPLFEPPIDPALLVKAAAAGIDIASALSDINATLPHYRFSVMAQKASELCAELKSLGGALLAALEKRDAEALSLLRSTHEIKVLNAVRQVKERQIKDANEGLEGLRKSRELAEKRKTYYETREFMNQWELDQQSLMQQSESPRENAMWAMQLAKVMCLIPDLKVGSATTWGATYGGSNLGQASQGFAEYYSHKASVSERKASMEATMGGYARRQDDWILQKDLAVKEIEQADKQITAAEIRLAIAERDLENHDLQTANAKEVDAFMRDKFTSRELYDWMAGQISGVYFQSYQLAYDVAKRAERAYRHELGLRESSFIQFGYWDSLKKGLMAGERLHHDLKRMEVAYLDENKREYEITKHLSLAMLEPVALVQLKQTGACFVSLPEAVFDLDYPGHYLRRLKSVSATIPCVTGPYTSVNCTLTLIRSSVRHANTLLGGKYLRQDNDARFADSIGAIQSIVTSSAQNDSGLFDPNLRDERYLPFEGGGVISEWRIELSSPLPQFDYDTITDVVMHLRYTAREGGGVLKQQAMAELQRTLNALAQADGNKGLVRAFRLRHEFASAWHRFLNPPAGSTGHQTLTMALGKDRFPFMFEDENKTRFPIVFPDKAIKIRAMEMFVKVKHDFTATYDESSLKISLAPGAAASTTPLALVAWNGLLRGTKTLAGVPGDWTLTAWLETGGTPERLHPDAIEDIVLVCHYMGE